MNETAQNIIEINPDEFGVIKYDFTKGMIAEQCKKYAAIKIIPGDVESYEAAKAAKNKLVKTRTGTDKHRLKIGTKARAHIDRANAIAKDLLSPLLPIEANLKAMIKEEDDRIAQVEQDRLDKIAAKMSELDRLVTVGQKFNIPAVEIREAIKNLDEYVISAVDFDMDTERAEALKEEGFEVLNRLLADRVIYDKRQADQEAEKARLEKERAEFHAAQVAEREKQAVQDWFNRQQQETANCQNTNDIIMYGSYISSLKSETFTGLGDREQEARKYIAALIVSMEGKRDFLIENREKIEKEEEARRQEAKKLRKANKEIKLKLLALEKGNAIIQAERDKVQAIADIKAAVANAWGAAHKDNHIFDAGWARAKGIDQAIEKKKLQADKKRAKLIVSDNTTIRVAITNLDVVVSKCLASTPDPCTEEGAEIIHALTSKIKTALFDAETAVKDLA